MVNGDCLPAPSASASARIACSARMPAYQGAAPAVAAIATSAMATSATLFIRLSLPVKAPSAGPDSLAICISPLHLTRPRAAGLSGGLWCTIHATRTRQPRVLLRYVQSAWPAEDYGRAQRRSRHPGNDYAFALRCYHRPVSVGYRLFQKYVKPRARVSTIGVRRPCWNTLRSTRTTSQARCW